MMESVMNPGMCRCCASEGAFKDIKSTYHWMGEEEIYADMLRECFDIILNASEQGQDGGICEVCITQLRNAINFKKQVLHTEDQFQKHLQNKTLFRPNIVKVEVQAEEDSDDNMGSGDEGFSGAEFEVPIKTEVDDPKPKKRAAAKAPATTTRASAKKAKADNGETSTKRLGGDTEINLNPEVSKTLKSLMKPTSAKANDKIVDWTVTVSTKNCNLKSTEEMSKVRRAGPLNEDKIELDKHKEIEPEVSKILKSPMKPTSAKANDKIVDWTVTVFTNNCNLKSIEEMSKVRRAGPLNADKIELDKHKEIELDKHKEIEPEGRKILKSPMKPTSAKGNDKKVDRVNAVSKPRNRQAGPLIAAKLEIKKHLQNIRNILLHSNATPIKKHIGTGYLCGFCSEHFALPKDLKIHTLQNHDNETKSSFMKGCTLYKYVVKLDITGLKCEICGQDIDGLEPLMNHLQSNHNTIINTDIKNHILPFIFEGDTIKCVLCPKIYESFKLIQEHMNEHYDNYVCETCFSTCVNKITLHRHLARHKLGEFSCKFCSKVFDIKEKKLNHEKFVHILDDKRSKCPYCEKKFSCHKHRNDHLVKEHERRVLKCMACDKTFTTKDKLNRHTKRDHLLEKKHECEHCEKKFYRKEELRNHMLKHTGEKQHKCDVCLKAFGRKYTLTEHLRIHANDRRFKCDQCGQAFVQKCSWKTHMRIRHNECV